MLSSSISGCRKYFWPACARTSRSACGVDAFPAEQFTGRVYALETTVDEKTRTVLLRARVANPGGRLKPGMFARVTLELGSRRDAVLVPEEALVPRGDKVWVFRVIDGTAVLTEVVLGSRRPGEVEITRGLAAGDVVVKDGQLKLQNGSPVMVVKEEGGRMKDEGRAKGGQWSGPTAPFSDPR